MRRHLQSIKSAPSCCSPSGGWPAFYHNAREQLCRASAIRPVPRPSGRRSLKGTSQNLAQKMIPPDNAMTAAKSRPREALYFDKRLSANGTVSCATCHDTRWLSPTATRALSASKTAGDAQRPTILTRCSRASVLGRARALPRRTGPAAARQPNRNGDAELRGGDCARERRPRIP